MDRLLAEYGVCALLAGLGLLSIAVSYGAAHAGRSGTPGVGAVLIFIGFLTSPVKWGALLALCDPIFTMIPMMLCDSRRRKRAEERISGYCRKRALTGEGTVPGLWLVIRIPERSEELVWHYTTGFVYSLNTPKFWFRLVKDAEGGMYVVYDTLEKGSLPEAVDFPGFAAVELTYKGSTYHVELSTASDKEINKTRG